MNSMFFMSLFFLSVIIRFSMYCTCAFVQVRAQYTL